GECVKCCIVRFHELCRRARDFIAKSRKIRLLCNLRLRIRYCEETQGPNQDQPVQSRTQDHPAPRYLGYHAHNATSRATKKVCNLHRTCWRCLARGLANACLDKSRCPIPGTAAYSYAWCGNLISRVSAKRQQGQRFRRYRYDICKMARMLHYATAQIWVFSRTLVFQPWSSQIMKILFLCGIAAM